MCGACHDRFDGSPTASLSGSGTETEPDEENTPFHVCQNNQGQDVNANGSNNNATHRLSSRELSIRARDVTNDDEWVELRKQIEKAEREERKQRKKRRMEMLRGGMLFDSDEGNNTGTTNDGSAADVEDNAGSSSLVRTSSVISNASPNFVESRCSPDKMRAFYEDDYFCYVVQPKASLVKQIVLSGGRSENCYRGTGAALWVSSEILSNYFLSNCEFEFGKSLGLSMGHNTTILDQSTQNSNGSALNHNYSLNVNHSRMTSMASSPAESSYDDHENFVESFGSGYKVPSWRELLGHDSNLSMGSQRFALSPGTSIVEVGAGLGQPGVCIALNYVAQYKIAKNEGKIAVNTNSSSSRTCPPLKIILTDVPEQLRLTGRNAEKNFVKVVSAGMKKLANPKTKGSPIVAHSSTTSPSSSRNTANVKVLIEKSCNEFRDDPHQLYGDVLMTQRELGSIDVVERDAAKLTMSSVHGVSSPGTAQGGNETYVRIVDLSENKLNPHRKASDNVNCFLKVSDGSHTNSIQRLPSIGSCSTNAGASISGNISNLTTPLSPGLVLDSSQRSNSLLPGDCTFSLDHGKSITPNSKSHIVSISNNATKSNSLKRPHESDPEDCNEPENTNDIEGETHMPLKRSHTVGHPHENYCANSTGTSSAYSPKSPFKKVHLNGKYESIASPSFNPRFIPPNNGHQNSTNYVDSVGASNAEPVVIGELQKAISLPVRNTMNNSRVPNADPVYSSVSRPINSPGYLNKHYSLTQLVDLSVLPLTWGAESEINRCLKLTDFEYSRKGSSNDKQTIPGKVDYIFASDTCYDEDASVSLLDTILKLSTPFEKIENISSAMNDSGISTPQYSKGTLILLALANRGDDLYNFVKHAHKYQKDGKRLFLRKEREVHEGDTELTSPVMIYEGYVLRV